MKPTNSLKRLFRPNFRETDYGFIPSTPMIALNGGKLVNGRILEEETTCRQSEKEYDFLVPLDQENWTLPQYESLFHHMFVQKDDNDYCVIDEIEVAEEAKFAHLTSSTNSNSHGNRRGSKTNHKEEGSMTLKQWLKNLFSCPKDEQEEIVGHKETIEDIPIEICERLRHIHVFL